MKIKQLVVALMGATLLFTSTKVYGEERVENRFDNWKNAAIVSPKKSELKPAGPIEVEFKQLNLENIKIDHYDIYIDGETNPQDTINVSNGEILTGEIYTTEVAVHTLQIVAVTDDNYEISSNIRKFLVSKKGLNIDDKAVSGTIQDMNESWYYNWGTSESHYVSNNKEFVPMIWGKHTINWLQSDDVQKYSTVLGFNEPDLESQSNLSVEEVAKYQDLFTATGLRIGSPATVYPANDWYQKYSQTINMDDIDFIPVHIYFDYAGGDMANTFLDAIDQAYEKYHKPIWVTEYGIANKWLYGTQYSDESLKDVEQYMKDTIQGLEERDYVERYTWFNFGLDSEVGGKTALYDQNTGELTKLGELYASLGNPKTEGVNLDDEYIIDEAYYNDLDDMIEKVDEIINDSHYQNLISDELLQALNHAKTVKRDLGADSQYIIDQLTDELKNEYIKILEMDDISVDFSVLKAEYEGDLQLVEADYTSASWKVFNEALTRAKEVLNNKNATQEEVDDVLILLKNAKNKLVKMDDSLDSNVKNDNKTNRENSSREEVFSTSVVTGDEVQIIGYLLLLMISFYGIRFYRKKFI